MNAPGADRVHGNNGAPAVRGGHGIHDVVILGGGITGLAVARLAAHNGISAVVLERGDIASGTSSTSSHMLHGGLRYLEHARFSLVRESLEQRAEVSRMAPRLAEPRRFLVPLYRGDRVAPWKLRAGLSLYDAFAGPGAFSPHSMVRRAEALALEPGLAPEGLRGAGIYSDVVMDDGRLAVAVARDAVAHGARIHTWTEALGARPAPDGSFEIAAHDVIEGRALVVRARVIVNATGPWTDAMRTRLFRALTPGAADPEPLLRPSRGVHLVFPPLTQGHGLLVHARRDGRVFFVVPFAGRSLVGTTEIEVPSPPPASAWRASIEEIRYLRDELRRALPGVEHLPPLALLSGLRPLLATGSDVGSASREHRVIEEHGVITVAGGKYTTFRPMARDVLAAVTAKLGRAGRAIADPTEPLPAPLAAGADLERVASFAVEHEFARRLSDVVRRRTLLWLEPDRGRQAAARIAHGMATALGWSPARERDEFQSYDASLWEEEALLQRSASG